jgi:5,10-methylenetetrahydromethanopterin reductase
MLSIAFQTDKALAAYGPLAAAAEAYGFDGVTVYNDMLYQPAWLPLLEMARATQRVQLGVAAVNPFTCHPVNIAGNIALLDEASGGRAGLGIARGAWLEFAGVTPAKPVVALREAFECVRHLLRQNKTPYPGRIYPLAGGDSLRWPILRSEIPFLLGSWGELGGSANPALAAPYRQLLDDAATGAGRLPGSIGIVFGAVCVVDQDGAAARARAKREVALYLPVIAGLDSQVQLEPALLARLKAAADRFDFEAGARLVSDELLRSFAFAGTPDEVAEHAVALLQAGAGRVEFGTPHGLLPAEGLRLLGERVLPAIRQVRG